MLLKKLTEGRSVTITYINDGALQTCKGLICGLDIQQQTLSLRDNNQKRLSIRLSGITEIHCESESHGHTSDATGSVV